MLKRGPVPDEEPIARGDGRRHRDHQRYGESERVRAGDDHHRHRPFEGEGEGGAADEPGAERQGTDAHGDRRQPHRGSVREVLRAGTRLLGPAHHRDHLGEVRLVAGLGDLDRDGGFAVHRPPDDGCALSLLDGLALARQHRFVDARLSFDDHAVGGDLLAGLHQNPVPADQPGDRNLLGGAIVFYEVGLGRHQANQALEGRRGPEH